MARARTEPLVPAPIGSHPPAPHFATLSAATALPTDEKSPPTTNSLVKGSMVSACTVPGAATPPSTSPHDEPSHTARLPALEPPACVKLPPAYMSPLVDSTVKANTGPLIPSPRALQEPRYPSGAADAVTADECDIAAVIEPHSTATASPT